MKKLFIRFADSLLTRDQLKKIKGGYDPGSGGGVAKCEFECCNGGTLVCEGTSCDGTSCNAIVELDATCRYLKDGETEWRVKEGCPVA